MVRGHHELKFGGLAGALPGQHVQPDIRRRDLHVCRFAGVSQNRPARFIGISPQGALDRYWRFNLLAFYAQDNWRASSRLTLNLGLRYEFSTMPVDIYGRDSALINGTDRAPTAGQLYNNPTYKNISPRFGFAWNPTGSGHTSVRGGYGLYFNTNNQQNLIVTVTNPPATPRIIIANPDVPLAAVRARHRQFDPAREWNIKNPYVQVWNISVQQELCAGYRDHGRVCGLAGHPLVAQRGREHSHAATARRRDARFSRPARRGRTPPSPPSS